MNKAIEVAKRAAKIPADDKVRVLELSRAKPNPLALVTGGGASLGMLAAMGGLLKVSPSLHRFHVKPGKVAHVDFLATLCM